MSILLGTDADETISPGKISASVSEFAGPRDVNGDDFINGGGGADVIDAGAGADIIFGGDGNDTLTGGAGDDLMFGGAGDDRMIWNPGDGSDLMNGGDGTDTAEINGGKAAEQFTLVAEDGDVRFERVTPAPFSIDITSTENIVVNMGDGDDSFEASGNLVGVASLTVDGGAGNDRILGSNGADLLLGGDGNDFIDGQQGADVAFLGAGDDVFQWDPGDGSDVVDGGRGNDTMLFNGSAGNEVFAVSADKGHARFTRNVGNIVMDLNDVERIDLNVIGGADTVDIGDLTGTDVREIDIDLAGAEAQANSVTVAGRAKADDVTVATVGTATEVSGLAASVRIVGAQAVNDQLILNTGSGNDKIDASALLATGPRLTIDAGAGNDRINGSQGADLIRGGDGNDVVTGDNGNDIAELGAGNDTFVWLPGDGSDIIDGQAGTDTMEFVGANASENISISANGERVVFFRDVGNVTMDTVSVERVVFDALGGADNIVVNDLTGTAADEILINLGAAQGLNAGDGAADSVSVRGSAAADDIRVTGASGASVLVTGLAADVRITGAEQANDRLEVRAGAGNDTLDASGTAGKRVPLALFGEAGDDRIIGSGSDDFINGGAGTDTVLMGGGNDRFQWNPGDGSDFIDGQAGFDTHEFNGSAANENFLVVSGGRDVLLARDVGNIVMDQQNVERIELFAGSGSDSMVIGDLRNTDVREVRVDLAGTPGGTGGDNAQDTVNIDASPRADRITVTADGNDILVGGLTQQMQIANADASDRVVIRGGSGADILSAATLPAGTVQLTLDGGRDNDVLIAGASGATLLGGAGDDLLIGGAGDDVLNAGTGNDILFGGGGNDLFSGEDDFTIIDFRAGAGAGDRIDLRGVAGIDDFGDVLASARNVFGGMVLDFGDDEITLIGVNTSQLHADDFLI